jgi:hypothetical protein
MWQKFKSEYKTLHTKVSKAIDKIFEVIIYLVGILVVFIIVIWGFNKAKDWYYGRELAPFWKNTARIQVCKTPYYSSDDCYFLPVTLIGENAAKISFRNGGYIITEELTCYWAADLGQGRYKFCRSWDEDGVQWDFLPANVIY